MERHGVESEERMCTTTSIILRSFEQSFEPKNFQRKEQLRLTKNRIFFLEITYALTLLAQTLAR